MTINFKSAFLNIKNKYNSFILNKYLKKSINSGIFVFSNNKDLGIDETIFNIFFYKIKDDLKELFIDKLNDLLIVAKMNYELNLNNEQYLKSKIKSSFISPSEFYFFCKGNKWKIGERKIDY